MISELTCAGAVACDLRKCHMSVVYGGVDRGPCWGERGGCELGGGGGGVHFRGAVRWRRMAEGRGGWCGHGVAHESSAVEDVSAGTLGRLDRDGVIVGCTSLGPRVCCEEGGLHWMIDGL